MDVDGDVDGRLAQQFCCLGTSDREMLIEQFRQILGPYVNLNVESCRFFLDMNNWNLQAALGSFYDYNAQDLLELPSMVFVSDITIGEGESVPPNTKFLKKWRLQNCGSNFWPDGCTLQHVDGDIQRETNSVRLQSVPSGDFVDVSVEMTSPPNKGIYQSRWQMNTPSGIPFGENIWCIITVDENGVLSLTQRLEAAHCDDNTDSHRQRTSSNIANPFSSSKSPLPKINHINTLNEHFTAAECSLDSSFVPLRSSPVDFAENSETSRETNCNNANSISLRSAIAAAFPEYNGRVQHQCLLNATVLSSSPESSSDMNLVPRVPPCTPCSPSRNSSSVQFLTTAEQMTWSNNGDAKMDDEQH